MKIFGIDFSKKSNQEVRSKEVNFISPFGDALRFGSYNINSSAMNIASVYRAVEIISDSIAILPIEITLKNKKSCDNIVDHPVIFAIENNILTKYNLIKLLIQSVLLKGNGFCYIQRENNVVKNLIYLNPSDVVINYNKQKNELFYSCAILKLNKIQPSEMIHLVKNSYDGINGISVLNYATRTLSTAKNSEYAAEKYFSNGCNLSGILKINGQLTQQQRDDIRKNWNSAYTDGGSGLAILQGNMEYQTVQMNAADAQLMEVRQYNVKDIARFFGISPVLLGDYSAVNLSTLESIQQQFLINTLSPYIKLIELEFTRKLFYNDGDFEINLNTNELIKTDKSAQASYYSTMLNSGILCINEVRKDLGLSEIQGGDKHIIPYTDLNKNQINKDDVE